MKAKEILGKIIDFCGFPPLIMTIHSSLVTLWQIKLILDLRGKKSDTKLYILYTTV